VNAAGGKPRTTFRRALTEFDTVDRAAYLAVANARTQTLDAGLTRLSNAANHSRLWLATAAGLAILGGRRQRHAAALGVAAIGLTSAMTNLVIKPVLRRARPDRVGAAVPDARHVRMTMSHSFPSGHAAAASAFATAVGHELPVTALPLRLLAVGVRARGCTPACTTPAMS
jgi:membrane-associated phospholipid phosphatase